MSIDVANRRRVVVDLSTNPDVFSGDMSEGFETGLEPAVGYADSDNGGNATPTLSGIPLSEVNFEVRCRKGGPVSAPYSSGGAQFIWREEGDGDDMWRGYAHRRAYRIGEVTEVVRSRVRTGTNVNALSRPSGVVVPFGVYQGRFVVAVERRTNSGIPANYCVDVLYRGSTDTPTWTRVADVVSGSTGRRSPRVVCRPDGMLIMYTTALNDAGTGYKLASYFSVDGGASWGSLNEDACDVDDFSADVDKITVEYAFGYYVMTVSDDLNDPRWLVSVDGGISFRQIAEVNGAPSIITMKYFTFVPLIDDTLLAVWIGNTGLVDEIRCTNVASGLDYPDVSDYRVILTGLVTDSVEGLLAWREYDGVPFIATRESLLAGKAWRVSRGTMDGVSWATVNQTPGLFSVMFTTTVPVDASPTDVDLVSYQGTWGMLWCNDGTASASLYTVEEASLNWTPGTGGTNVGTEWDWQFVWSIAAGSPSGTGLPFTFVGTAGQVSLVENPTYIRLLGTGNTGYWEVSSTSTVNFPNADRRNADMTAVVQCAFKVDLGSGSSSSDQIAMRARGSDGSASREVRLRLHEANWYLLDGAGVQIATGARDNTAWTEWILGVTKGTGGTGALKYSVRARAWNQGRGDRVWENLATGSYVPPSGAGASTTGDIKIGSINALPPGDGYDVVIGSFTLNQGVTSWEGGDGSSLFDSDNSSAAAGHVMSVIPVPMREDVYISFDGDVAATGDNYTVQTRNQYGASNLSPGERGEWRSAEDGVDHYVILDYGSDSKQMRWDTLCIWGSNFRKCKVSMANTSAFTTGLEEYELDATVAEYECSGSQSPSGSATTYMVLVTGANWSSNQWVDYLFEWTSGTLTGKGGRVIQNTSDTLLLELPDDTVGWISNGGNGSDFALFTDRMFYALSQPTHPKRFIKIEIESRNTPEGYYKADGFMRGTSHVFDDNWEWENEERRAVPVETVESPGGQRYVYRLGDARREVDVEFTGIHGPGRSSLDGLWRVGKGGERVVCFITDVEGGPDCLMPARIVGDLGTTTRALYVQNGQVDAPVLTVVDVDTLTFSEEVK